MGTKNKDFRPRLKGNIKKAYDILSSTFTKLS